MLKPSAFMPNRAAIGGVFAFLLCATVARAGAGVNDVIRQIERLPRSRRIAAYLEFAHRPDLSESQRATVVNAFAKHAKKLSPVYGKHNPRIDFDRWEKLLWSAHEVDPSKFDVAFALAQLLIDQKKYQEAQPVVAELLKAYSNYYAPRAFSNWCKYRLSRSERELLTIPVYFCTLTRNPSARARSSAPLCRKEVDILNEKFRTMDGEQLVRFTYKGSASYRTIQSSKSRSPLLAFGDSTAPYKSGVIAKAFNATRHGKVRDHRAINFYIIDSYSRSAKFGDVTSHGVRNSNRPYVLIDWERLGNRMQNPEPHEMGHAFGLGHVGVLGARGNTKTNTMTSAAEKFGSGGTRDVGFSESQAALIVHHAKITRARLGLR